MLKLKPIWITLLTMLLFGGGMALGTTSDWWQTDGRKTPLDGEKFYDSHEDETSGSTSEDQMPGEETYEIEEDHTETLISGETTIQQALDLGIPFDVMGELLEGEITDTNQTIKAAAQERGLQFGVIKDELNARLMP